MTVYVGNGLAGGSGVKSTAASGKEKKSEKPKKSGEKKGKK